MRTGARKVVSVSALMRSSPGSGTSCASSGWSPGPSAFGGGICHAMSIPGGARAVPSYVVSPTAAQKSRTW